MRNQSWSHAAAGMALGTLGAWLGFAATRGHGSTPLMLLLASGLLALAMAELLRRYWPWPASFGPSSLRSAPARGEKGLPGRDRSGRERAEGNRADGERSALVGHEMKNYLCTLKGNARLLRQRVSGRDQVILDRIDRVVEKLESFTRGLGQAGDGAVGMGEPEAFRPVDAARSCARTHFHKRMADFRFREDPQATEMLCDPGRFEQVLLNLYANALEAGARRIHTEASREQDRLLIRVEDDGEGCAREDLQRIFEPFFTTKTGPARRGLGMFIVQSIVENHGGRVRVAAKNGGGDGRTGLIFTLEFPMPPRKPEAVRPIPLLVAELPAEESWMLAMPEHIRSLETPLR